MKLIILNYSMKGSSLVFGHQREVVKDLARLFPKIHVVTAENDANNLVDGVRILNSNWQPNHNLSNTIRYLRLILPLLLSSKTRGEKTVIFSYMTEVQSSLIAPITRIFRIPHFLWYAHTTKSFYARWCHFWCDGLITSTKDSCPYSDRKVHIIGQSIDPSLFPLKSHIAESMASGISVGRLDKSKNLESIINLMYDEELCAIPISLTFVGDATSSNESYVRTLKVKYADLINCGRLKFIGKVPNNDLSVQLARHDFFINGFVGSLDKSLIEATLVGLPVITVNPPYLQEFGSWSEIDSFDNVQDGLKSELLALRQYEKSLIETSRKSRREIAQVKHSRNAWVNKLHEIFLEA